MLDSNHLEKAIAIQNRCFNLLQWLGKAIREGFIPVTKAHDVADAGHAAKAWVEKHLHNLPPACRPETDEIEIFANFFGTYLETSFDVIAKPGERYINECGCFCPMCSRLANPQHLKAKSVTREEKNRAAKLRLRRMEMLAREENLPSFELRIRESLHHDSVQVQASLSAYGSALMDRLNGISHGPSILALWRDFAWTKAGAPNRSFKLKATVILDAEQNLLTLLRSHAAE